MGMELILREWMGKEKDYSISYSTYMNLVLYAEGHGYYMKDREKIGRQGDFFTSSNVSSAFAKTFAKFFTRLVENDEVAPNICEIGGEQESLPMMFYKNGSNYLRKPLLI